MTRIATKEGFTSITKEEDGGQDASSGCARSLHRFIARSARVSTRARFGKDTAREVLVARRGTEPSAVATGSRMTAPCRSRSGSNDRARTHRRLLRLQELGQNLAHAPVRQLIARRQGFLERVADDLRAFARGWGVSAGWPRPRVRAGASERNDSLTGGGGGRATRRSPSPPTPLPRVPCRPRPRSSPRAGRAATPSSPARVALATLPHARDALCRVSSLWPGEKSPQKRAIEARAKPRKRSSRSTRPKPRGRALFSSFHEKVSCSKSGRPR